MCKFCDDIFKLNRECKLPEKDSILYEDEYIYVLPDICPLVTGHILIISKEHFDSYANASAAVINAVNNFLNYYRTYIGYREFTIFEHGSVIHNEGGTSVEHAHIHVIPIKLNMQFVLNEVIGDSEKIYLKELHKFSITNSSYLYFQLGTEEKGYAYKVGKIKSQFLREVVNQMLKQDNLYDWKTGYSSIDSKCRFYKTLAWWSSLKHEPSFKWKKKLILEKYGFIDYFSLIEETNRYEKSHLSLVINLLEIELSCLNNNDYIRLVFVPLKYQPKLTNYILKNVNDLNIVKEILNLNNEYEEIWYYKGTNTYKSIFSGRISFDFYNHNPQEIIEIVGGDDPRKIESLDLYNSEINYLRASRQYAESIYHLDEIQITNAPNGKYLLDFLLVLQKKINACRKSIDVFGEILFKNNINSFSLEYKMHKDGILFIDWDSSNDVEFIDNENL